MLKEIGSEFWIPEQSFEKLEFNEFNPRNFQFDGDVYLVLSGRTAIDLICRDIQKNHKIKNVYMPAYCCESMIFPFTNLGVNVEFYDMGIDNKRELKYYINDAKQTDILFLNNYFGFPNTIDIEKIEKLKENGAIVIYDRTHSLFLGNDNMVKYADYSFASIRKWMEIATGAIVNKRKGHFFEFILSDCPYADIKIESMRLKSRFIEGDETISKSDFFDIFNIFNKKLKEDYAFYKIDNCSLNILNHFDFATIMENRKRNAVYLYGNLKCNGDIFFPFGNPKTDAPLFLPILLPTKKQRDNLSQKLIKNDIYCPIHWPKSKYITSEMKVNYIYDRELSLVCDQRYDIKQMKKIIDAIIKN